MMNELNRLKKDHEERIAREIVPLIELLKELNYEITKTVITTSFNGYFSIYFNNQLSGKDRIAYKLAVTDPRDPFLGIRQLKKGHPSDKPSSYVGIVSENFDMLTSWEGSIQSVGESLIKQLEEKTLYYS